MEPPLADPPPPWSQDGLEPGVADRLNPGPTASGPLLVLAWVVILLICGGIMLRNNMSVGSEPSAATPAGQEDDGMAVLLMEMQAKYMVYAAQVEPESAELLYNQAQAALGGGSIGQRQRFTILAAELMGLAAGADRLTQLEGEIDQLAVDTQSDDEPFELGADQDRVNRLLTVLYEDAAGASLTDEDRAFLVDRLGWFGKLGLRLSEGPDDGDREAVLAPARRTFWALISAGVGGAAAALAGFIGLLVCLVLALTGRLSSGLQPSSTPHGIYAETFAIWLVLFIGLQIPAGLIVGVGLLGSIAAFLMSLVALFWPRIRGVDFPTVRRDIGWTLGRQPAIEPLFGLAGYAMALPILAVGVLGTLFLMLLQQQLTGGGDDSIFRPTGSPAHPIIEQLAIEPLWPKIQVLLLGAIAAPIVEETMFRGVLYRHLREATSPRLSIGLSIVVSGLVGGFLFAAVHPQGWIAIPALTSLAFAFTLMREWRGTVIPSMVMHGVSNGLVLSLLILALGS